MGITANQVTLSQVWSYIAVDENIYGKVTKVEFYVNEVEAKKMRDWWENRYKHLKVYSVYPWTGEQCTTAVKTALIEGGFFIEPETQTPSGILSDLNHHVKSISAKHYNESPIFEIIKDEDSSWTPELR